MEEEEEEEVVAVFDEGGRARRRALEGTRTESVHKVRGGIRQTFNGFDRVLVVCKHFLVRCLKTR